MKLKFSGGNSGYSIFNDGCCFKLKLSTVRPLIVVVSTLTLLEPPEKPMSILVDDDMSILSVQTELKDNNLLLISVDTGIKS